MKYQAEGHKAEILGNVQTMGGFQIKADGKAFTALTSNLYSNQIGACVRELSTNASDAHREAGNADKPFDVHLPTELEPFFFIRDYGTGLSHEQMQKVYTVIFESTKDNSNDATGCFGLGSKTPLSYNTRSFIVYSYQNGKERSYSAYFREDGIPDIAFQDERDTDEEDGLKVFITARKEDIPAFIQNAKVYLPHFSAPSANVLNPSFEFVQEEVFVEGKNWRVLSKSSQDSNYLLMGPVPYPINLWNVTVDDKKKTDLDEVKSLLSNLSAKDFIVEFQVDMGDVTPQLSREELYYDERTCDNIMKYVKQFKKELIEKIQNKIEHVKDMDSYFQACMDFTNFAERKFSFITNKSLGNPSWNGDIPTGYEKAFNSWLVRTLLNLDDIGVSYTKYFKEWSRNKRVVRHKNDCTFDVKWMWDTNYAFAIINDCKGYRSRVRNHVQDTGRNIILLEDEAFKQMKDKLGITDAVLNKCNPTYGENFGYEAGKFNYIDCNDLEKPTRSNSSLDYIPKEGRVNKESIRANVIGERIDGDYHYRSDEDVIVEADYEGTVVYGRMVRGGLNYVEQYVFSGTDLCNWQNMRNIRELIRSGIGIDDNVKLIGIKGQVDSASFRKAASWENWISYEDYVKEWIENNEETIEALQALNAFEYNISSLEEEVANLHPKLKAFNDKVVAAKKELEDKVPEDSRYSLPYKDVTDLPECLTDLKAEHDEFLKTPAYQEWKEVYYHCHYNRSYDKLWNAHKFQIEMTYDEDMNLINPLDGLPIKEETQETEAA